MRTISKRVISILLAVLLIASMSIVAVSALGEYTPSEGVKTNTLYFAMPGLWANDTTRAQNNVCGAYWWSGSDQPDYAIEGVYKNWPGWRMKSDENIKNLRTIQVPQNVTSINFDNFIDGGEDESAPVFKLAKQTVNINIEGDWETDNTPCFVDLWNYVSPYKSTIGSDNVIQIDDFGTYSRNVYFNTEFSEYTLSCDKMIYVVNLEGETADSTTHKYGGQFYFYYGNGEYGAMPTKQLLTQTMNVRFDSDGKAVTDGETLDTCGNITRTKDDNNFVAYGKFDEGRYIEGYDAKADVRDYTPSAGTETNRLYFAMPGIWANEMTRAQNNDCGVYWGTGTDSPDDRPELNYHGWPGWRMKADSDIKNLRYIDIPTNAPNINFNNFIDGGEDENAPIHKLAVQTPNINIEGAWEEFDQDPYFADIWSYITVKGYKDGIKKGGFKVPEFGDYAGNLSYNEEFEDYVFSFDNMVYVVNLDSDSSYGRFYFYYGNGEYGRWPTKELLTEHDFVDFDAQGNLITDGELFDKNGNVYRTFGKENYTVYGKFDEGKYIEGYDADIPDNQEYLIGDISFDDVISVNDATLAQQCAAELIEFNDVEKFAADCNGDGIISVADATLIQKYAAEFTEDLLLTGKRMKMK